MFDFMGATLTMLHKVPAKSDDDRNPVRLAWGVPAAGVPDSHFGGPLVTFPFTDTRVYIAFIAFLANLVVTIVLTVAFRAAGIPEGTDRTSPDDYRADVDDADVNAQLTPETPTR